MDTEQKRIECLKRTDIGDIWGIGHRIVETLKKLGIFTAYDFITKTTAKQVRALYNIELERTWRELHGEKCINIEQITPDKQSIATTRMFPAEIKDMDGIKQAVSTYAAICAANLRAQNSYASSITVYLETNRFGKEFGAYNPSRSIKLSVPTNTSPTLVKSAMALVEDMFIEGFKYKKAGVVVGDITDNIQTDLFNPHILDEKYSMISPIEDLYSHGFDRRLLSLAVMGYSEGKDIRKRNVSPCFTTNFNEILRIDCQT